MKKQDTATTPGKLKTIVYNPKEETKTNVARQFLLQHEGLNSRIARHPVPQGFWENEDRTLQFMVIDLDYSTKLEQGDEITTIRMFGVTQEGFTVLANVYNFEPYLYSKVPDETKPEIGDQARLKGHINSSIGKGKQVVNRIEIIEKYPAIPYQPHSSKFLKIFTDKPKSVVDVRNEMEKNIFINGRKYGGSATFESNIPFALRFMIDKDIGGMSWVSLASKSFKLRKSSEKISSCQIEVEVASPDYITSLPAQGDYLKNPPLRFLSFDIESRSESGKFPVPERDQVIQIANICKYEGQEQPFIRNVFCLKSCASIPGAQVFEYGSEKDLLEGWAQFLRELDPDIITGYNIVNFDLTFLLHRAAHLRCSNFSKLSRLLNYNSTVKDTTFSSKGLGTRDSKEINIEGRIQVDMFQILLRDYKLSSYSLNSVSAEFLKEQKEDVPHTIISTLQDGNETTRRRLAIYCIKDAYLPLRLMEKLMSFYNYTEMARVTGVPFSYLLRRGQQIKVMSQLLRKAKTHDILVPYEKRGPDSGMYEGATVIEPKRGFYRNPIATLDFSSLYPSIMMAHNLCYSTFLDPKTRSKLSEDDYIKTPNGDYFVRQSVKKGLLPLILEELISARKRAKKDLETATDPFVRAVYDGRQLALKISANSVYGFTGAQEGMMPCLAISSSVTAFGREMIHKTRDLVLEKYKDCEVIYGDTDSVMVKFNVSTIGEAMTKGKEAAEYVSGFFNKPIKLEFEKVYCPYLLMQKKKYAGLLYKNPDKHEKIDAKGIETVRRDNCQLVREVVKEVLDKLLIDKDEMLAIDYCKGVISDLLQNKIDMSLLVITRGIGKKTEGKSGSAYAAKSAHVELAEKIKKRDEANAPAVGDRVAYIMVKGAKGSKAYENAEDPIYVLENNLTIDFQYYLEHQLKNPLIRIFEPIINVEETLFKGQHTRNIYVAKSKANFGLGKFITVSKKCMGCGAVLKDKQGSVCVKCIPKLPTIYMQRLIDVNNNQKLFNDYWVQCQRCQGSILSEVICQNRDCPIFYRRVKAKKNLEENLKLLSDFQEQDALLDW